MDQDPNQRPQEEPRRIPTPDVEGVPPPPRQGASTRRWVPLGLGGCAVLIVLLLLVVGGCAAIFANIGGDTDSKPGAPKSGTSKEEQATVPIGEPVTVGDVQWTVTNADRVNRLESSLGQFGEPKQGNFVVVDFNFTNNSNEPLTLSQQSLALLDSEGRESRPDPETFEYIPRDRNIFLEQVNPGVTEQGRVIFTVAPDASGFRLQAGDARALSNENAYVDLGF